ncbi:MAG TPA: cation diffusion facilitator family transporter [Pyrinomonadaceae bacterium]|jgi:cation diffusion facilitator family transporter
MSENQNEYNLPDDKADALERARRLEYWSLFFLFTIIVALGLTMGASQAMKAMWAEDFLSLVPTSAVLIGIHFRRKKPDAQFPYGYRRAVQICFLAGAIALFGFGVYILIDSILKLIMAHHPTIQTIELFGTRVWLGWLMIGALVYSIFPPLILGRMKLPLAAELHDKTLQTDATIDKGDWLAGLAGIAGILGIAYGFWWADAVAGGIISVEIVKDGYGALKNSVQQLMNMRPTDVENKEKDPIFDKVQAEIENLEWVKDARIRLREDGDVIAGEAFVVPTDERDLMEKLGQAGERVKALDWRIYDFNIVPVSSLD